MVCRYRWWSCLFVVGFLGLVTSLSHHTVVKTLRVSFTNTPQEQHTCTALPLLKEQEEYIASNYLFLVALPPSDACMMRGGERSSGWELNFVTFDPKADPSRVLHLSVQVCDDIPGPDHLWSCGDGVPGCIGKIRPVYVWGMNSTTWRLPPETGIPVGGESGGRFIVLQAHIKKSQYPDDKTPHQQYAEVKLRISKQRPRFEVGLMILGNTGFIPPSENRFVTESACKWKSEQSALILGYRLHTHSLGRWMDGFAVSSDGWQLIGEGRPLSPENVHRSFKKQILRHDDYLVSRCYYENLQPRPVNFGSGFHDEMCNFHVLYIFPYGSSSSLRFRTCAQNAQTFHLQDIFSKVPREKQNIDHKDGRGHVGY